LGRSGRGGETPKSWDTNFEFQKEMKGKSGGLGGNTGVDVGTEGKVQKPCHDLAKQRVNRRKRSAKPIVQQISNQKVFGRRMEGKSRGEGEWALVFGKKQARKRGLARHTL